jgi:hypothetical protein
LLKTGPDVETSAAMAMLFATSAAIVNRTCIVFLLTWMEPGTQIIVREGGKGRKPRPKKKPEALRLASGVRFGTCMKDRAAY